MKFKRYITEKRAELTGDQWKDKFIKQLNQWDKDISRMTKLYKSLKATRDDLKNFRKAKKAFIIFGQNFEKWIYQDLLDKKVFGKESESGFTKDVRVKAWDTLHFLNAGNLFPMAWNYKNDKHEDAPEELDYHDGGRKNKILRWQRSWRKTKEAIVELIQYQSETLKERQPDEQVQVAGVNILIKNQGDEWTQKYLKRFMRVLPKAVAQIKKQGMSRAMKDFKVQINFRPETVEGLPNGGGLTAGAYDKQTDILYLFPLGLNDNLSDSTLIHEIGHRYWFKYVPERAKNAWKDKIEKRMVAVETKHIDKFFEMFYDKEWGFPYRKDFANKLKDITDPTLKIIFRYLSDHTPLFDVAEGKDKETVYKEHMIKHNRGEQIPLEWITDYGRTNDAEAFAEAFKLWVGGVKGKLGAWTRAFFKEIVRTGGSSLRENELVEKYLTHKKSLT